MDKDGGIELKSFVIATMELTKDSPEEFRFSPELSPKAPSPSHTAGDVMNEVFAPDPGVGVSPGGDPPEWWLELSPSLEGIDSPGVDKVQTSRVALFALVLFCSLDDGKTVDLDLLDEAVGLYGHRRHRTDGKMAPELALAVENFLDVHKIL